MPRRTCTVVSIASALSLFAATATATTAQRTFVASYGKDANPCSLTLPCRSFAAAVTQAASGGEVIVLDSAGYGPVTIVSSVTIAAPSGVYAGISVPPGGEGVVINAPGAVVTLKGLMINGQGNNAEAGINFLKGAILTIENCEIANVGFSTAGIVAQAPGGSAVVRDTLVRGPLNIGISVYQPTAGQATTLIADNVAVQNAGLHGIYAGIGGAGTAEAYLSHVTVTGSGASGIVADSFGGGTSLVSITNSTISGNGYGVVSANSGAKLIIATTTVARSTGWGLVQHLSSTFLSRGDNTVHDNNGGGVQTLGTIGSLPPL